MGNQIQLAWSVVVTGTTFTPAQAAAALAAVVLYLNATTDPTLGQALGLTVASDTTATTPTGAKRTLVLNMTAASGAPFAPPPFPCHPLTPTPPVLPYPLEKTASLAGDFAAAVGSPVVPTTANQNPSLSPGNVIQFASQLGVDYTVLSLTPTAVTLTAPFTGPTGSTKAFRVLPAPSKLPALYSTLTLDTAAGNGARTISISYLDSTGLPGTVVTALAGKRPVQVALAGGTVDISTITDMHVALTGGFQNSVGEITLSDLSAPIIFNDTDNVAQLKIDRALAYLPPSFYALAQQGAADVPAPPTGDQLKVLLNEMFARTISLALIMPISETTTLDIALVNSNATQVDALVVT